MTIQKLFNHKPRTIDVEVPLWAELRKKFSTVSDAVKQERNLKIKLYGEKYLLSEVWTHNGKRYTGFHTLDEDGQIVPYTGVNLDEYEWHALTQNAGNINDVLFNGPEVHPAEEKFVKKKVGDVLMFRGVWQIEGDDLEEPSVPFFTEKGSLKTTTIF